MSTIRLGVSQQTREPRTRIGAWGHVLRTTNAPANHHDLVTRWLVITRAAVLPLTWGAGLVAGFLAVRQPGFNGGLYLLAMAGILLAHIANNLMNDLYDARAGSDSEQYPRLMYAPHPVLSGLISMRGLITATLVVNALDLAILVVLAIARGWVPVAFALAGFVLSIAYTAPPLRLKKRGLGEPDVFVVWGPLMVCGVFYAATGTVSWAVVAASLPTALLCTTVLMGKHTDKIPWDAPQGIRTIPVLLGAERARSATLGLMIAAQVAVVADVVLGVFPVWALLSLLGIPWSWAILRAFTRPRPEQPPMGFPVWPLWYAALAFLQASRTGGLLCAGVGLGVILGFRL